MDLELRIAPVHAFHVRRGGGRLLSESDEDLHHLAPGKGTGARAGNHVAQRAMGRSFHAATRLAGDDAGLSRGGASGTGLASRLWDLRLSRRGLGGYFLQVVP